MSYPGELACMQTIVIIALHYHCYDLFVCLFVCFFMLKLLQYCNYIIIVMQIKLMLLLLLLLLPRRTHGTGVSGHFIGSYMNY